jgi:uncharacterized membrane protein
MGWLIPSIIVVLVVVLAVTAWFWHRSRDTSSGLDGTVRDQQAAAVARERLHEHRYPRDGGPGSGSGGVGAEGW